MTQTLIPVLNAELRRMSGAELSALRDSMASQVERCGRLANGAMVGGGIASDTLARIEAELTRRLCLRDACVVDGPEWRSGAAPRPPHRPCNAR